MLKPCLLSPNSFFIIIVKTSFFEDTFHVNALKETNSFQLHMVIYLQVAIISQALIFITRSHGFFFTERPSFALMGAFAIAQLISSIIAAYGNWYGCLPSLRSSAAVRFY
jgi:H+-transporting ATPase